MRYLLAYDFCAHCLRRESWALKALGEVPVDEIAVSAVTVGRVSAAVLAGASNKAEADIRMKAVRAFFTPIQIVPFGTNEAMSFAAARVFLSERRLVVDESEVMTLATADARGLIVVTGRDGATSLAAGNMKDIKQSDWSPMASPPRRTIRANKKS